MTKLSIMVPVYNMQAYLGECLQSLTKHDWADEAEIIIIDDGSMDNSMAICEKYAAKYPYISVYHKENGGVSSARNMALQYASGEYFYWVDPDDYVADDFWQRVKPVLEQDYDFIFFDLITLHGSQQKYVYFADSSKLIQKNTLVRYFCDGVKMASHLHTKILKKSLWDGINFSEDISLCEDYDVLTHIIPRVQKAFYLHESLYYYRQSDSSITHNISLYDMQNVYRLVKERYLSFRDCGYDVDKTGIAYVEYSYMRDIALDINLSDRQKVYQDLYDEMRMGLIKNYSLLLNDCFLHGKDKIKLYLLLYDMKWSLRFLLNVWQLLKSLKRLIK